MTPDNILSDLPRGEQGRAAHENNQPHHYFETLTEIARHRFRDGSGDIFLGVVNGHTATFKTEEGREELATRGGALIGIQDDRHITTFAGSRSGKGVSLIIPNLLSYKGSVLVIDPKGENAARTAEFRANVLKQNVCIIDPFGVTPSRCARFRRHFDPLHLLKRYKEPRTEDAALLAEALVAPGGFSDTHWDESARAFIQGVLLHVVTAEHIAEEHRTIVTAADLILGKFGGLDDLLNQMEANPAVEGRVIAAARAMKEKEDKEKAIIASVARRNMGFLEPNPLRAALSAHDVDLDDLKDGNLTIYLVLPAIRLNSCRQFFRLFINLTLESAEAPRKPKPAIPTLMILDEFAILSRLRELEVAIGMIAGFGLKIWVILQDLGQLRSIYNERAETFVGNSGIITVFGIVDYTTSKWVSDYLDKTTITVRGENANIANLYSPGSESENKHLTVTDLMTPAEVRQVFARGDKYNRQLILIAGKRPWVMQRATYYSHEFFKGRYSP